jgi:hypothetical protein
MHTHVGILNYNLCHRHNDISVFCFLFLEALLIPLQEFFCVPLSEIQTESSQREKDQIANHTRSADK